MKKELILSGNCYWTLEALFQQIKGILKIESGLYHIDDYEYAFNQDDKLEAIRIEYNPTSISLEELIDIFYISHNPTINKWDKESCFYPLCRSAVFCFEEEQQVIIKNYIQILNEKKLFDEVIDTKIDKIIPNNFYLVELKNQNFFKNNPKDGYCISMIKPKLDKLYESFPKLINKF